MRFIPIIALLFSMAPSLVYANESTEEFYTYAPNHCEFQIEFPSEPSIRESCAPFQFNDCPEIASYTQVYGTDATVTIQTFCNPVNEDTLDNYTEGAMVGALEEQARRDGVTRYETSFLDEETGKRAGLLGEGLLGRTEKLYVSQFWLGHNSIMSIEAELVGEALPEADALFTSILRSVALRADKNQETTKEQETKDNGSGN